MGIKYKIVAGVVALSSLAVTLAACTSSSPGSGTSASSGSSLPASSPSSTSSGSSGGSGGSSAASSSGPSSVSSSSASGAQFDSCTIVTQAEAGTALGQTVSAPARGKATVEGGVACVFYGPSAPANADPDVPVIDSVRVVLVTGALGVHYFADYRSKVQAHAVLGLGVQAFFEGASLSVLKDDEYLRVAVIGVPDVLAAEKVLARAVLPRM